MTYVHKRDSSLIDENPTTTSPLIGAALAVLNHCPIYQLSLKVEADAPDALADNNHIAPCGRKAYQVVSRRGIPPT